ncbi:MAG: hypothetical protein K9K64_14515 [Desulfohalobiaceae bacterium]|nr:hypothetical protein [Desulfohalobiaceae bacterium]
MSYHVLVTHQPEERQKKVISEVLKETARISYLHDLSGPGKQKVLTETDVVLGLSLSPREIQPKEIQQMEKLRFIQVIFAGADNIPFGHIPEGISVAANPGAFAEPIAEHVLAMSLALAKSLVENHLLLARGRFEQQKLNKALKNRICGVVGLGGNGKAVACLMKAVGMRVHAINRTGQSDLDIDFLGTVKELPFLLQNSDVLVLCVPLTRQTNNLITKQELRQMKQDAILINVARGDVINQRDLYQHLRDHPEFQAGIDTWWVEPGTHGSFSVEHPFFELPNLLGSPHNADDVQGAMTAATKRAAENVRRFLLEEKVSGKVDRKDYVF